jgi:hypothetical protein
MEIVGIQRNRLVRGSCFLRWLLCASWPSNIVVFKICIHPFATHDSPLLQSPVLYDGIRLLVTEVSCV